MSPKTARFRSEDTFLRSEFDLLGATSTSRLAPDRVAIIEGSGSVCLDGEGDGLGISCGLELFIENR